jgi:Flp pilus assembly protein CpaB
MLLGVLLALVAGVIVIYIVNQATGGSSQQVSVLVAKAPLSAGKILSVDKSDSNYMLISDAFVVKQVSADFAPPDAFAFKSQEDENVKLNNQVLVGAFFQGDILRQNDPRLVPQGTGASGSLTNVNPALLLPGQVITQVELAGKPAVTAGDAVDILVTECNLPNSKSPNACETQTTLQNIPVYAVRDNFVFLVLDHQQALVLKYLSETGKVALAIRKPGDKGPATTQPVDPNYVVKSFGY